MQRYQSTTALIVVDMQNDFADPGGSLYVQGGDDLVGRVNREVIGAAAAGAFVVYTQDWHPPATPHFEKDGGIWPVHCVVGTRGAEFHPRLVVAGPTVRKGEHGEDGYSGFTMRDPLSGETAPTPLNELLEAEGSQRVVVIGLALDYCVGATALDAAAAGYETLVPTGLTAAVDLTPGDGDRMLASLSDQGVEINRVD